MEKWDGVSHPMLLKAYLISTYDISVESQILFNGQKENNPKVTFEKPDQNNLICKWFYKKEKNFRHCRNYKMKMIKLSTLCVQMEIQ